MKLREIFTTLSELLQQAAEENHGYPCSTANDLTRELLTQQGFRPLSSGTHSIAYCHDGWGGIVLKFGVTCSGVDSVDLREYPFLKCVWLRPLFCSEFVMVQPRCDTDDEIEAWDEVRNTLENHPTNPKPWIAHDIISRNVGWYRGRAVAFDMRPMCSCSWREASPHGDEEYSGSDESSENSSCSSS